MSTHENRNVSKHTRRRTLEDDLGTGRLNVEGMEEGYYYHVVNDEKGRVERLKARGFEVVEQGKGATMGDANAKQAGSIVQTAVNKEGTKGILMRQPIEFREEDNAFKNRQIDEAEKAMFRQSENEDGRYGEIKTE